MEKMAIDTKNHRYPIYVGTNIYHDIYQYLDKDYSRILIITDSNVANLYLEEITSAFDSNITHTYIIPSGEYSKDIETFYNIHTKLIRSGFDRNSLVVALGGGMVGDIAGFVAATFMRGIDFIQVPTTILAHDSSIGGKVAINHALGKNLIGQFYHPKLVLYDITTLETLPKEQIRSGYAELIKESLIDDRVFLKELLTRQLNQVHLKHIGQDIVKGIQIKKKIVEKDEKENGIRKYLNLGHTLGHALEAHTSYKALTHGEAVAIGTLFAIYISNKEFKTSLPYAEIKKWFQLNDYPLRVEDVDIDQVTYLMKSDKKSQNQVIHMVLLQNIGQPYLQSIDDLKIKKYLHLFFRELGGDE